MPLHSTRGTVGTYVYGTDYDIAGRKVRVNVEAEVANEGNADRSFRIHTVVRNVDGKEVLSFDSQRFTVGAGSKTVAKSAAMLEDAHFWSWGYGYLYTVATSVIDDKGAVSDEVLTRTGFRKTQFAEGKK